MKDKGSLLSIVTMTGARWMAASFLAGTASTGAAAQSGFFTYTINSPDTNTVTIIAYTGSGGAVTIPSTITNKTVTSIGNSAFNGCAGLTSVTIPGVVASIGDSAFYGCSNMTAVTIPNSVTNMGSSVFYGCGRLTSVTIPSVTSIRSSAFYGCVSLTGATIPGSVTNIGDSAFYNCTNMTGVTIPGSVASIGTYAFFNCGRLTSVTIPNGVTNIGNSAFYNCTSIAGVTIPGSVASIGTYAFFNCGRLTNVTIPNGVTSIGNSAFCNCTSMMSVIISDTVTNIRDSVFSGCSSLTDVTIPNGVTSIGNSAFYSCTNMANLTIGSIVTDIGSFAFYNCRRLASLTIPDSVTSIGNSAFYKCSSLTTVVIGNGVTSLDSFEFQFYPYLTNVLIGASVTNIGPQTFNNCSRLTSVTIGDSVTGIGNSAFYNCTNLGSVVLGSSVANLGTYSFYNCKRLPSIAIPNSVTNVGNSAFYNCTNLSSVVLGSSVANLGTYSFHNCRRLPSISIPNSVTNIGEYAFGYCSSLTNAILGNNLTCIEYLVFSSCSSLRSITIPDSVTNIGDYAFSSCSSLTNVAMGTRVAGIGYAAFFDCGSLPNVGIPNSVTRIGWAAFMDCTSLTNVTIPNSVASMEDSVFSGCSSLIRVEIGTGLASIVTNMFFACSSLCNVTIPDTVTRIEYNAFGSCISLTNVTISGSVTSIGDWAFDDCSHLTRLMIPDSVISIGDYAFSSCSSLSNVAIGATVANIGNAAFNACTNLASVIIPGNVVSLGSNAFFLCSSLTNITIGYGVTSIGDEAFGHCSSLQTVCFEGNRPTLVGSNLFDYSYPTVYFLPTATGWDTTFEGRPTVTCDACQPFVVIAISPSNQEQNVFWDQPDISAQFLQDVDSNTVNAGTFYVAYGAVPGAIPGAYSVSGRVVRFTPAEPLDPHGRTVLVWIKSGNQGVTSVTHGLLASDYRWSFSTMPSVTVQAVTAQVVDGMDWVQGKDASVRIQALWGGTGIDKTDVAMITGKVTVVWNGGGTSEVDRFVWSSWDGRICDKTLRAQLKLNLTDKQIDSGNAVVFSSASRQPLTRMPLWMNEVIGGPKSIRATVELTDSRRRTRQFVSETNVTVKARKHDALSIEFVPLSVGLFTIPVVPGVTSFIPDFARVHTDTLRKFYPLPGRAVRLTWKYSQPYVSVNAIRVDPTGLINWWSNYETYLEALCADMENYREQNGLDFVVGVVPARWLSSRQPGVFGSSPIAHWPVAIVDARSTAVVSAHEAGHYYAYATTAMRHSTNDTNSSGFDPVTEYKYPPTYSLSTAGYGDFMVENPVYLTHLWVNRQTYTLLMNYFVEGGASSRTLSTRQTASKSIAANGMQDVATNVLAVAGILMQTDASCAAHIVCIYPVANQVASTSSLTGDYDVEALTEAGGLVSSVRINPVFMPDEVGRRVAFFKVYFGAPSSIERIVVKKVGLVVGSVSRPVTPPTVVVTAPAQDSIVTSFLTVSWIGSSSETTLTYNVFFRPDPDERWSVLGYRLTNQTLTVSVGDLVIGSNAQVRVVANDGFNTVETLSGFFRVQYAPFVVSCSPSNAASFVSVETDVRVMFSSPMAPSSITTNTLSLRDSGGAKVTGSVYYDSYAQQASFTPKGSLAPLSVYTVRVDSAVASVQGQTLTNTFVSAFKTSSGSFPPVVWLTEPSTGSVLTADVVRTVAASVEADTNRFITKMEFFVDGQKIGEDSTPPFTYPWSPSMTGTSRVTATVYDDEAGTGSSEPAYFRVVAATVSQQLYTHGNPSADEQALLERINDARENPPIEGIRLALTSDTNVLSSYQTYGVNTNQLITDFAAYPARPPLAFNSNLMASARRHALDMATHNFQANTGSDGSTVGDRIFQAGYEADAWAENNFVYAKSVFHGHAGMNADWGNGSATSRMNIMNYTNTIYREIGISQVLTNDPGASTNVGPRVDCYNFGLVTARTFLVGVVFADLDGDWKYDPGEGLAGVTVRSDRSDYFAVSSASGGYAIPLTASNGIMTVRASGGCLPADMVNAVALDGQNKRLNFVVRDGALNTRPTVLHDGSFGMRGHRFGFNINWLSDREVVIEATTNLITTNWFSLETNVLIDGTTSFTDTEWTNYPSLFYRIRSP